jgi:uncharacterized membrane protein
MMEIMVFAFDTEDGALKMRDKLLDVQKRRLVQVADAAVVIRQQDGKVKVKQLTSMVGAGTFGGAFWGLLIGLFFWAPWLGLAIGAAAGAAAGSLVDVGVDDKFIQEVSNTIQPGHSALFLMAHKANLEKVLDQFQELKPTVLQTSLSAEDEAKLRAALGAADIED